MTVSEKRSAEVRFAADWKAFVQRILDDYGAYANGLPDLR